ncbi:MAG: membrane protein [Sandaracinaceae bacterium]
MTDRTRARIASAMAILVVAAAGAWAFDGLRLRTDVDDFVPQSEDAQLAEIAREVTDSELSRTTMLTVGPYADAGRAVEAARTLGASLASSPHVAWVRTGPPADVETTFYELYFPRRLAFAAPNVEEARALGSDEGLRARITALRAELTGPTAMLVRRIAPEDPILAFPTLLRAFQGGEVSAERPTGPRLEVVDGAFVAREGEAHFGVVLLASRGSTFRAEDQEPVLRAIDDAFARLDSALRGGDVRLEQAGVARFAVRTEQALRGDTTRISAISTVAIVVLFVALYRGPRYLALGALPLGVGTVASVVACRIAFGSVHAITLAFGSSLLGVGIDFISHYVNQHVLEPRSSPEATMAQLRPGMVLGALTTIAGLAGLGLTTFPGMRELAVFAAVGVLGSLVATLWLVPPWMPERAAPTALHLAVARSQAWLFERVRTRVGLASLLPLAAVAICAVGLPRLAFVDDLRRMNEIDPALAAEDRAVRTRVAQGEAGRFVMAIGADDEEALAAAERAEAALAEAVRADELRSFRSIVPFLRSAASQRAVDATLRGDPTLAPRLRAVLASEGFVPELFAPFEAALAAPAPDPLTFAELARSPIAPLVEPFRVEVTGAHGERRVAYLAFVDGVADAAALDARLAPLDGIRYFDQARYLEDAYRSFRERSFVLVVGGLVMVFALCLARYRGLVLALAAVLPALLASLTSLALVALSGVEANLMHLVACLLVLSMGEDYAVFLLEERDAPTGPSTTMTGILVACVTTVLSFGLLAVSGHPALRALGVVTSLGVALAFVLAPLALVVARLSRRTSDPV